MTTLFMTDFYISKLQRMKDDKRNSLQNLRQTKFEIKKYLEIKTSFFFLSPS